MPSKKSEDALHEIYGLAKFLGVAFNEITIANVKEHGKPDAAIRLVNAQTYPGNDVRRSVVKQWECRSEDIPKTILLIRDHFLNQALDKVSTARRDAEALNDQLSGLVDLK